MNTRSTSRRLCLIVSFFVILHYSADASVRAQESVVRAGMKARLEMLQNLVIQFEKEEVHAPPPELLKAFAELNSKSKVSGQGGVILSSGSQKLDGAFRFLRGNAWYEKRLAKGNLMGDMPGLQNAHEVQCYSRGRVEHLRRQVDDEFVSGQITDPQDFPHYEIDVPLGLRLWNHQEWLTSDAIDGFEVVAAEARGDSDAVAVRHEELDGTQHLWSLSPQNEYAIVEYAVRPSGGGMISMKNSELKDVQGLVLPSRVEILVHRKSAEPPTQTLTFTDIDYTIGSSDNNDDSYTITWPLGAQVFDTRVKEKFLVKTRPRSLDDETINRLASGRPEARWSGRMLLWVNLTIVALFCIILVAVRVYRKVRA